MNLVSLADLGNFLFTIFDAYESYLFFAFTLMMSASVLVAVRRLLIGVKQ